MSNFEKFKHPKKRNRSENLRKLALFSINKSQTMIWKPHSFFFFSSYSFQHLAGVSKKRVHGRSYRVCPNLNWLTSLFLSSKCLCSHKFIAVCFMAFSTAIIFILCRANNANENHVWKIWFASIVCAHNLSVSLHPIKCCTKSRVSGVTNSLKFPKVNELNNFSEQSFLNQISIPNQKSFFLYNEKWQSIETLSILWDRMRAICWNWQHRLT